MSAHSCDQPPRNGRLVRAETSGTCTRAGWNRIDPDLVTSSLGALPTNNEPVRTPSPAANQEPVCPRCRGARWYVLDVPVGDPRFGVLQMCACLRQSKQDLQVGQHAARQQALITVLQPELVNDLGTMATATFASFRRDRPLAATVTWCGLTYTRADQLDELQHALAAMHAYATHLDGWRLLLGPTGAGKSHLAGAVWTALRERGVAVLGTSTEGLLRCLRQGIPDHAADDRLEAFQTVDVLILDEFGVEHRTPWALEKLYALLHIRSEAGRPTLLTGNLPLELLRPLTTNEPVSVEAEMRWERLISRIAGMCGEPLTLVVSDYRRRWQYAARESDDRG